MLKKMSTSSEMMGEDLRYWKPRENTEYNGWNRHHSRAYVLIYFRKEQDKDSLEEHYGGFDILGDKVKIWYVQNGQKLQRFVPRSICEFSKTISGRQPIPCVFLQQLAQLCQLPFVIVVQDIAL